MQRDSATVALPDKIEIHHPQLQRFVVCAACVAGGIITVVMCFLFLPRPWSFISLPLLAIDLLLASFFWRYFGSFVIRADAGGISRSTMLHTQAIRWDEIDTMQMQRIGNDGAILTMSLEDENGNTLLGFRRGFATRREQEQLLAYIRARMAELDLK
jgi:hypothetical protein